MTELACCICTYDLSRKGVTPAFTVIEGFAVCYDHMGYVAQGKRWHDITSLLSNFDSQPKARSTGSIEPSPQM